jgi:uncharacterized protein involved in outer membrane biogenesis
MRDSRRGTGKGWIALLSLLALLLGAAAVGPRFIDWSPWRQDIADALTRLSGRAVALDGPVELSLLPIPSLIAADVRMGEAAGGRAPYFARADRIEASLDLPRLLTGRIAIASLTFVNPEIDLVDIPADRLLGTDLPVERIRIIGGSLGLPAFEEGERITRIDGEARWRRDTGDWRLNFDFHHRLLPWRLETALGSSDRSTQVTASLIARGGPTLRLAGQTDGNGKFSGRLRGDGDRASELLMALGLPVPPPAKNRFALDSRLEATRDGLKLEGVSLSIGEQRAQGSISFDWLAEPPRAELHLTLPRVDLTGWSAAAQPPLSPRRSSLWMDGTADIRVETLEWKNGLARNLAITAALSGNVMTVTEMRAQLPGGADVAGSGTLDLETPHAFTARFEGGADDPRPALEWLDIHLPLPEGRFRRVSLLADLRGDEVSLAVSNLDLSFDASRLQGTADFSWRDRPVASLTLSLDRAGLDAYWQTPDLSGSDPHTWLKDWEASLSLTITNALLRAQPVSDVTLKLQMADGLILLDDFSGGTSGDLRFSISGQIDRRNWPASVDLRGNLTLADLRRSGELLSLPLPGVLGQPVSFSTPLALTGTLDEARLALAPVWGSVRGQVIGPVNLIHRQAQLDIALDSPGSTAVLEQLGGILIRPQGPDLSAALTGQLILAPNRWDIRNLALRLADLAANGQFGMTDGKLAGGIGLSGLTLTGWDGPLYRSSDLTRWLGMLPEGQLAVRIGQVSLNANTLQDISLLASLKPRHLTLNDLQAGLLKGRLRGSIDLSAGEAGALLTMPLTLDGLDLAEAGPRWFGTPLVGSVSLAGTIRSNGASLQDLWTGQNGTLNVSLGSGNISDLDLSSAKQARLAETPEGRNALLRMTLSGGGNTPFTGGKGQLTLDKGQIQLQETSLALDDGGQLRLTAILPLPGAVSGGPALAGRLQYELPGLPIFGFEARQETGGWQNRPLLPE